MRIMDVFNHKKVTEQKQTNIQIRDLCWMKDVLRHHLGNKNICQKHKM